MVGPHLLSADDLVLWANSKDAEALLPELIIKLIQSDAVGPIDLKSRTGAGTNFSGADIFVKTDFESSHVPRGQSVWEVTTHSNTTYKANLDLTKSAKEFSEALENLTFIGVTLRRWSTKQTWINQHQEGWKRVVYLDADDVYLWLLNNPAVHFWLSFRLGRPVCSIRTLQQWWSDWTACTTPVIEPEWLLVSRENEAKAVRDFARSSTHFSIGSVSNDEATAFLAAALLSSNDDRDHQVLHRSLVVESIDGFAYLANTCERLLIVAKCDLDHSHIGVALRANRLFLPGGVNTHNYLALPKLIGSALADFLESAGWNREDAASAAATARNSLDHLRKHLGAPVSLDYKCSVADIPKMVACILARRWSETNSFDKEIIAKLAGSTYEEIRAWLISQADANIPLFRKSDQTWFATDSFGSLRTVKDAVSSQQVTMFIEVSSTVLTEDNPALDLDPDKRWMASILGKETKFSHALKIGLSQTIAELAVLDLELPDSWTGQSLASHLVRKFLSKPDHRKWSSLAPYLPNLAEASPDDFLSALEQGLQCGKIPISSAATDLQENSFVSAVEITYVIWALERLAWAKEHLARVTLALAAIAEAQATSVVTGATLSMIQVFTPWYPCTFTSIEERFEVIDLLRKRFPSQAWELLLSQLPQSRATSMCTARPEFRDWSHDLTQTGLRADRQYACSESLKRLAKDAGTDQARWVQLVHASSILKGDWGIDVIRHLEDASSKMSIEVRTKLWQELREHWSRHVQFGDSDWAMDAQSEFRFRNFLDRIAPESLVEQNLWLFEQWVRLPEKWSGENHDYEAERVKIRELRLGAVKQIFDTHGLDELFNLVDKVSAPNLVGEVCVDLDIWEEEELGELTAKYLHNSPESRSSFVGGFLCEVFQRMGSTWLLDLIDLTPELSPIQKAWLVQLLPFSAKSIVVLAGFSGDVSKEFWKTIRIWSIHGSDVPMSTSLEYLVDAGRATDAVRLFAMAADSCVGEDVIEIAIRTLEAILANPFGSSELLSSISRDIGKVIDWLSQHSQIDIGRLAPLEFAFLPILDPFRPCAALAMALSSDPKVLVELVSIAYVREGERGEEPTDKSAALSTAAYRTLDSWKRLPGERSDGSIDGDRLKSYVSEALLLASTTESVRLNDVASSLGTLLANSPPSESGGWPCFEVCEILEEHTISTLHEHFAIEVRNQRGLICSHSGGGDHERELEGKYRSFADSIRHRYPLTAALLSRIASDYAADAYRNDRRAEERRGF